MAIIPSAPFEQMAKRIAHNRASETAGGFGGAAVIIPPADGGEPIEFLIDDAKGDPALFYSTLLTRVQFALKEIEDRQRKGMAFGR